MLHSAVFELRQHLCCVNVFLKFKQSLNETESLKINVDETKVQLQNPKCIAEIYVNKYFTILAGTFSNLIVDLENAAFRISIKDVQLNDSQNQKEEKIAGQLNLAEQDVASVLCSNCKTTLVVSKKYEKIREFPSGAIDVSEFFCHHGPCFKDVLVPGSKDLFYGFQFIVLNREVIENATREKENHLYCKRCLRYLGETLFNGRAAKLWCDSLRLNLKDNIMDIFASSTQSQIHKLMLKVIEETSLPSPEPLLRNMHFTKVLLEASFPDRLSQYLLVHILEKHLPVLRLEQCEEELTRELSTNTRIELKPCKAFKILYRLIASKDEEAINNNDEESSKWPPLLEYWQQDINILKMKISPFLFSAFHKELGQNINVLPEIYRVNNDDFLLSYIFY
ncbi:hypothetical protein FF38_08585 [Lucilia cuprina]|uniref:E3 ubiquitin-protein ligase E3D n=1 Tax=Lucilia cuprina TaxID=7375 RepID=A0A0L0C2H6_LUCCU|nr:hypothetical protein CVS40_2411 [Lucilia cuprina]KNC26456.1 hypothetical protein FF38_08585 [Lucilia cuprina]